MTSSLPRQDALPGNGDWLAATAIRDHHRGVMGGRKERLVVMRLGFRSLNGSAESHTGGDPVGDAVPTSVALLHRHALSPLDLAGILQGALPIGRPRLGRQVVWQLHDRRCGCRRRTRRAPKAEVPRTVCCPTGYNDQHTGIADALAGFAAFRNAGVRVKGFGGVGCRTGDREAAVRAMATRFALPGVFDRPPPSCRGRFRTERQPDRPSTRATGC